MLRGRPLHACSIQGGACPRACARPHCALHLRHQAAVALTVTSFCALNMPRDAEQTALSRHSRCASHGPAVWKRAGGLFACVRVADFRALQVGLLRRPPWPPAFLPAAPQQSCKFLP